MSAMGAAEQLRIDVRHEADRVVLNLHGELDMATAPLLQEAIDNVELDAAAMVVLDLQQLQFIDSTGLRILLLAHDRAHQRAQEFAVTPGSQQVQRLLSVTGVGEHLRTIATADELFA
jgi:anti-sigma B factor antagonist